MSAFRTIALLSGLALFASQSPAKDPTADKIVVYKEKREIVLLAKGKAIRVYRIALGGAPVGPKEQQGDRKTPEGTYVISGRNPHSQFHRSIHISYPSAADRARARKRGVSPGGDIFLHGLPNGMGYVGAAHRQRDWTDGCIAVTSQEIEEIWDIVPNGTPVEIRP